MAFLQATLGTTAISAWRQTRLWPLVILSCLLAAVFAGGAVIEGVLLQLGDLDPAADAEALQLLLALTLPIGTWEAVYRRS